MILRSALFASRSHGFTGTRLVSGLLLRGLLGIAFRHPVPSNGFGTLAAYQ